jgi:NTE family protein
MPKQKFALVLGGGGARGAYQVGAWKALRELGYRFEAIIGTSVGCLNMAFIAQDDLDFALDTWYTITPQKIVNIPHELFHDGRFHINRKTISIMREIQHDFIESRGFDTAPLKKLINGFVNEDAIRKSGIDIGIETYDLNTMKPVELFLEDIEPGMLTRYMLASSSLPGFKTTKIKGNQFADGGLYDNVPFNLARKRGYTNLIVIDVSGWGITRKPLIEGAQVIYIKNSINIGSVIDFRARLARQNIELGYLDTMRIFGKVSGTHYFFTIEKKVLKDLEKIMYRRDVFETYSSITGMKNCVCSRESIDAAIRKILPPDLVFRRDLLPSLAECAARSYNVPRLVHYSFSSFLLTIFQKHMYIKRKKLSFRGNLKSYVSGLIREISRVTKSPQFFREIFHHSPSEYEMALSIIVSHGKESKRNLKTLASLFPALIPARIFTIVLEQYYEENRIDRSPD